MTHSDKRNKTSQRPARSARRQGLRPQQEAPAATLFAGLNHDVRTPLTGIIGMLNLLLDSGLSADQFRLAQAAHESAGRLFSLLRDVLDYSVLEAGEAAPRSASFDLCDVLDQALRTQVLAARKRGIVLAVRFAGLEHAIVRGNALALAQVMSNVVDALMAHASQRHLQVEIEVHDIGERQCRLAVRAWGTIAAAAPSLQDAREVGLRMALNLRLLASMDGQAGIEHAEGEPEAFWFKVDFPMTVSPLRDLRLLFIEADSRQLERRAADFAAHGLRAEGFPTATAALGALTRAAQTGDPYRIVILEENLQGVDGRATGKVIADDPLYEDSRLLMLSDEKSARSQRMSAALLGEAGFTGWLERPLTMQHLLSTLAKLASTVQPGRARPFLTNVNTAVATGVPSGFAGYRILAVDDHEINLQLITHILKGLECDVTVAADGEEAVRLHRERNFDLIFMDCLMPQLDGYRATALVRELDGPARHTPVVAITAATLPAELEKCRAAGMDDVITKPLVADEVREALMRWLRPTANDSIASVQAAFGDEFIELAALFQGDSPKRLQALQRAVAARETLAISRIAHTLAGSSISIGAISLSDLCRELEMHCRTGATDGIDARLRAIESEYDRIDHQLRAITSRGQR